ncbi:MAG: hypothetical protein ACRDOE_11030, partial [Streptosporangiaceae bacterium]
MILGAISGFLVIVAGGAAAAIMLTHHHTSPPTAVAQTQQATPSQAPATPSVTTSAPAPTLTPSVAVGPGGWTYPKPIDQQAYTSDNADINSLSCVTAVKCFAVDSGGNVLASKTMNSWQTVTTDAQTGLTSISCASAGFCAAVDNSGGVVIYSGG